MSTFSTPAPISAAVDIIFGDITVHASPRTDTVVEVRPVDPNWELDVKAAADVVVDFTAGKLQVKHPKLRSVFSKRYGAVDVLIELPAGSDLQGYTAKGAYVVEGQVGACELKTANGDIRVDAVAGNLRAKSATGHITVEQAGTEVHARTANGDIRVGALGTGTADLYTATGEVAIGVPAGTAADLDARTSIGRVFNNLDATEPTHRTVTVRARTHGGNITLTRA
ncbi:MAG TPA: DUF4097 family beta strand repeat-containing protein [Kribbella sp.]